MRSDHDSRGERISLRNGGSAATWYLEEPPERRQEPRREVGTSEFSRNCQVGCPEVSRPMPLRSHQGRAPKCHQGRVTVTLTSPRSQPQGAHL